ncbi:unnamed protein product [Ectocarpus sp. CCAP 1310/34]|nr:unnamed protein product [Ectocarpus sp. CCAP 1310/34]
MVFMRSTRSFFYRNTWKSYFVKIEVAATV